MKDRQRVANGGMFSRLNKALERAKLPNSEFGPFVVNFDKMVIETSPLGEQELFVNLLQLMSL